jgi:hypothetical protein
MQQANKYDNSIYNHINAITPFWFRFVHMPKRISFQSLLAFKFLGREKANQIKRNERLKRKVEVLEESSII